MSVPVLATFAQGQGVVPSDSLNSFIQTSVTVAQLRGYIGTGQQEVALQGTAAQGDGGEGFFVWSANSTAADDNGATCVQPSAAGPTGRWLRLPSTGGGASSNAVYYPCEFLGDTPALASETMKGISFAVAVTFPANFANSTGSCLNNPASNFVIIINKNGSQIGTITVSTSGGYTFVTTVAPNFNIGDRLTCIAPATVDATGSDYFWTFVGTLTP